jgi:hypothetical protein
MAAGDSLSAMRTRGAMGQVSLSGNLENSSVCAQTSPLIPAKAGTQIVGLEPLIRIRKIRGRTDGAL